MSDYTPTIGHVQDSYCHVQQEVFNVRGDEAHKQFHAEFDRMIAEVERAAAEKALTDAATDVEDLVDGYESTADEMRGRGEWADSNRYSNYSAGLNMAVTRLRARAEAYRQERGEQ
jgi:hypothetical protein